MSAILETTRNDVPDQSDEALRLHEQFRRRDAYLAANEDIDELLGAIGAALIAWCVKHAEIMPVGLLEILADRINPLVDEALKQDPRFGQRETV